jgi:DNA-3-methyladenine glycosylase I
MAGAGGANDGLLDGRDGVTRCWWCGDDPLYVSYHDEEWGRPLHGDRELFELLTLEAFQSGLAWITILRKRDAFREAFEGFDPERVAAYGEVDRARLLADAGIVRNRAKVDATIANAQAVLAMTEAATSLDEVLWAHAPPPRGRAPRSIEEIPAATPDSAALAKELKRWGVRFVGPTVAYALMQSAGLVDDHLTGCHRAGTPPPDVGR